MKKLAGLSLLATLLLLGCNGGNGKETGTNAPLIPFTLNQPIDPSETKALATSFDFSCILDKAGHPHCWANPKRFVPGSDSHQRGGFAVDYPKKENKDLAAHKFVNVVYDSAVCAVSKDGRVLCFQPDKIQSITTDGLNSFGPFAKVATTSSGGICLIDRHGTLACYSLKLENNSPRHQYVVNENIAEFSAGATSRGPFGCWISTSGILNCEAFDTSSVMNRSNLEVLKLRAGSSRDFSIIALTTTQSNIHHFEYDQKAEILRFDDDDRIKMFTEIAVTLNEVICGVLDTTKEIRCGGKTPAMHRWESSELEKQVFTQISISSKVGCGLRGDKIITCWRMERFLTGIPTELRIAE